MNPVMLLVLMAVVAVAVSHSATAVAQFPTGGAIVSHHQRAANIGGDDLLSVRKAAHDFGFCAAATRTRLAEQAVDLPVDDKRLRDALERVSTSSCLDAGILGFSPIGLRAALFEGLYNLKFGKGSSRDLSLAEPFDFSAGYRKPLSNSAAVIVTFAEMGACAVRKKQMAAWELVMSEPGSATEQEAIAEIQPVLPGCLPKGLTYRASVDILRGGIAEALYRLSERAPIVAGAHP